MSVNPRWKVVAFGSVVTVAAATLVAWKLIRQPGVQASSDLVAAHREETSSAGPSLKVSDRIRLAKTAALRSDSSATAPLPSIDPFAGMPSMTEDDRGRIGPALEALAQMEAVARQQHDDELFESIAKEKQRLLRAVQGLREQQVAGR